MNSKTQLCIAGEHTGDEFSFPKNNNGDFAKVKINRTKFSLPFYPNTVAKTKQKKKLKFQYVVTIIDSSLKGKIR